MSHTAQQRIATTYKEPTMQATTWTQNDVGYWELARSAAGDWVVFDVRDEQVIQRFATIEAAQAWIDAIGRGDC
jgi:hypothetical protein